MAEAAWSGGKQGRTRGLTVGVEGVWMAVQWRVVAVLSRCCAVPSSSVDVLDWGDVLCSGDTDDVARLRHSPFFFLFPLFSLGSGVLWTATMVAAGQWESARAPGAEAFIAEL